MECVPTSSELTTSEAKPLLEMAEPMGVLPSKNCTLPEARLGVRAAVSVTSLAHREVLVERFRAIDDGLGMTVIGNALDELVSKT